MTFHASAPRRPRAARASISPKSKKVAQGNSSSPRSPRSTRPRAGSARKAPPPPAFSLSPGQQERLAAIFVLLIAVLTFLGALNLSGGNILDGWTRILSVLFGWGRVLAPFFFGGLGAWLLLDSLDMRPDIGWERPLGLILLFLVVEGLLQIVAVNFMRVARASMPAAQAGLGGGLLGHLLYDVLVGGLGLAGALLVLIVLIAIGLILLLNLSFPQILHGLAALTGQLRAAFPSRSDLRINRPGRERIPTEMVTGRERLGPSSRPRSIESGRDRSPAPTTSALQPYVEPPERELIGAALSPSAIAARIVGGSAPTRPLVHREWRLPRVPDILEESAEQDISEAEIRTKVKQIEETLTHFGVPAKVIEVNQGPTITQFGVEPGFLQQKSPDGSLRQVKVKVNRISALQHDLELALSAAPIRVEAPVPGKNIVGIEVPNSQISRVSLRGVIESEDFQRLRAKSALAFALGQDVSGQPIVADLGRMPHLLVAGATGSGKSVCINALISCLLLTNTPDAIQFVMIDPKRVELSSFNGIPHLLAPVVVEMDLAVAALNRAVQEMDERYKRFANAGARNIESYNALPDEKRRGAKMPYLIIVVDELADLMMTSPDEVEHTVTRLAQMARATGIHLVLATQRPSVDVVTGLIKANFPSRISFAVTSQVDSRVVLDTPGAEKLLGRGDMLYMASDSSKLARLQGCFVSDRELDKLVSYWKGFVEAAPPSTPLATPLPVAPQARIGPSSIVRSGYEQGALWNNLQAEPKKSEEDDLLDQAIQIVRDNERTSVSLLQRKLRIGYSRAARLMELLEQKGLVGPDEGPTHGRAVLRAAPPPAPSPRPSNSGIIRPSAAPRKGAPARGVQGDEGLGNFDDFTDKDWEDLDRG